MKKHETKYIFNQESLILLGALFLLYNILAGYFYDYIVSEKTANKILIWTVVSITVLIHFVPLYVAAKVAIKLNRDEYAWGFLGFIFPFIGLVILSKLDYNFPDEIKSEAIKEIEEFKTELKCIAIDFQRKKINRKEYNTKRYIIENKINKKLSSLIRELDSNNSTIINDNKHGVGYNVDTDKYLHCPACNYKLNDDDLECPDCGLNLS